jgi:hypothetical protein
MKNTQWEPLGIFNLIGFPFIHLFIYFTCSGYCRTKICEFWASNNGQARNATELALKDNRQLMVS